MREFVGVLTADLRRQAGLVEPPFSTTAIIDACSPDTLVTGALLPPGLEAMAAFRRDGPAIVYQRSLCCAEQRVAVAHSFARVRFGLDSDDAGDFAAELLVPLEALRRHVAIWPAADGDDRELYLDHVDGLASRFVVTADIIDAQIRRLEAL